ncbi:MAG: pyridoxamine 5'-phosphate oxidase family protein [Rhodocyclaceae bacterium]|nr:pyridoxamine 5'-phosphate oxidase family protein [Rhodocyclaceae bacterium]
MSILEDPALARFVSGQMSMHVAACDARGFPTLVRGVGYRIDPGQPARLRVLVPQSQSEPVLRALAANGRIAVVLSEPASHRTLQLKGGDARVESVEPADVAAMAPYVEAMVDHLRAFDTPEPFMRALLACSAGELAVVSFTPAEVFGQTPGPQAGARLASGEAP